MSEYNSPGVYIEEESTLGNSIVPVTTAVPAFVGYTEKATKSATGDLHLVPTKVSNLMEFNNWYGGPNLVIKLSKDGVFSDADVQADLAHPMYYAMQLYFANGGGPAYIVSVGTYPNPSKVTQVAKDDMEKGLDALDRQDDASLIYFTDAMGMAAQDRYDLINASLDKAGQQQDRFMVVDVGVDEVETFRTKVTQAPLGYGGAYYPPLQTTIPVQTNDTSIRFLKKAGTANNNVALFHNQTLAWAMASDEAAVELVVTAAWIKSVRDAINAKPNIVLYPGAAVLGTIVTSDNSKGVWHAPANIGLAAVVAPTVAITDAMQGDLNQPDNGKAINAVRKLQGRGTVVWGARTLDGNSNDWRFIQVRRTITYIEQSIKNALFPLVFEANDEATWVKVRSMIESFLSNVWREGGLAGAKPEDAFQVFCGLGSTMTAEDVLNGTLNVNVLLAVTRPAEFIAISLTQSMESN